MFFFEFFFTFVVELERHGFFVTLFVFSLADFGEYGLDAVSVEAQSQPTFIKPKIINIF